MEMITIFHKLFYLILKAVPLLTRHCVQMIQSWLAALAMQIALLKSPLASLRTLLSNLGVPSSSTDWVVCYSLHPLSCSQEFSSPIVGDGEHLCSGSSASHLRKVGRVVEAKVDTVVIVMKRVESRLEAKGQNPEASVLKQKVGVFTPRFLFCRRQRRTRRLKERGTFLSGNYYYYDSKGEQQIDPISIHYYYYMYLFNYAHLKNIMIQIF
mmetsp:Transcript_17170/g.24166  ORF Transcript_17170/g.24166 Transcript_17170/m.24166 type:complete len:211 (-) Transcript_17170:32-664(-)